MPTTVYHVAGNPADWRLCLHVSPTLTLQKTPDTIPGLCCSQQRIYQVLIDTRIGTDCLQFLHFRYFCPTSVMRKAASQTLSTQP